MSAIIISAAALAAAGSASAFYLPGVAPHSFTKDEPVELKVNKLRFANDTNIVMLFL
jgi:hypothetical protein